MLDETWLEERARRADEYLQNIGSPSLATRILMGKERNENEL